MRRLHLFEFSDLPFWPGMWRALLTDFLDYVSDLARPFVPHASLIAQAMSATGTDRVIDLCSGSGGPWTHMVDPVEQALGRPIRVTLTDRFPRSGQHIERYGERMSYCTQPVDALAQPSAEKAIRTLFDSFHHFAPDDARRLLQNMVDGGHPLAVFEMLRRTPFDALLALRIPLLVAVLMPRVPGDRFWRLIFTYLIPVAPLAVAWDGFVSVLRCYRAQELLSMTAGLRGRPYHWQAGEYRRGFVSVTYLVGYPAAEKPDVHS